MSYDGFSLTLLHVEVKRSTAYFPLHETSVIPPIHAFNFSIDEAILK